MDLRLCISNMVEVRLQVWGPHSEKDRVTAMGGGQGPETQLLWLMMS